METSLNLTTLKSGVYGYGTPSRLSAPSGSELISTSPRQTSALLPTEMTSPTEQEAEKQDVTGSQQEQKCLIDEARQLAEKANAYLHLVDTHLEFKVSEQTGRVIISVVESDTQEVVRQIPPEALDRFTSRVTQMRGLLFEATG